MSENSKSLQSWKGGSRPIFHKAFSVLNMGAHISCACIYASKWGTLSFKFDSCFLAGALKYLPGCSIEHKLRSATINGELSWKSGSYIMEPIELQRQATFKYSNMNAQIQLGPLLHAYHKAQASSGIYENYDRHPALRQQHLCSPHQSAQKTLRGENTNRPSCLNRPSETNLHQESLTSQSLEPIKPTPILRNNYNEEKNARLSRIPSRQHYNHAQLVCPKKLGTQLLHDSIINHNSITDKKRVYKHNNVFIHSVQLKYIVKIMIVSFMANMVLLLPNVTDATVLLMRTKR